jgi:MFS family permease
VLVGRAIQGLGSGGIFPVASAVIGDTFPPEKRGGALGLIGAVFGLAFLVGPILGAVILSLASWRWLFLLNLPIALVVIVLSLSALPGQKPSENGNRVFDWQGMTVLAVMLASLAWAVNHLDVENFVSSLLSVNVLPFLAIFIVLLVALVTLEKKAENPIVSLGLFDRTQLRLTYALSAGAGFGEASLVFMPLLAVVALGRYGITEHSASWMLMPVVIAMAFGSPMAGRFLDRFGSRAVILVGTSVMTVGMILLGLFSNSLMMFIVSGVLIGVGMSALLGAPLRYIMLNEAKISERSIAQGVLALFTSTGQLLGGTLTGAIAASRAQAAGDAAGYSLAFLVIGGMSILLVIITFLLKNRAQELATVQQNEARHVAESAQVMTQKTTQEAAL